MRLSKTSTPSPGKPADQTSEPRSDAAAASPPKRLYRPIDWLTLAVTTFVVMAGYMYTLAPDLTLEDSGELAVASLYAGIPHPPGYPVWTLFTWVFANFLPVSNIAWRVAVGSAFAGALSCGLIGLMVSRGSSMLIESIPGLKDIERRSENLVCIVAGFVAGGLLAFNGFMWSQSVIVEVYSLSVLSLVGVLACLLRWVYTPDRRRYLYWAFFIFGICFTNHQTLILAAMGIEVLIALADHRLGRNFFLWNSALFLAGLILISTGLLFKDTSQAIVIMFWSVGICSMIAYVWLAVVTRETFQEFMRDGLLTLTLLLLACVPKYGGAMAVLATLAFGGLLYLSFQLKRWNWGVVFLCGLIYGVGVSFYLYMALAGATNPPMQWGYPRIVEGFWHALSRGQYEKANPTNIIENPGRFVTQLQLVAEGVTGEFSWILPLLAIVPFLFLFRMQKRERAWILGLFAMYVCMALLLVILLNPSPDKASRDLTRVFFTASHVFVAMLIGYGLSLITALAMARHDMVRRWLPIAAPVLVVTSLDTLVSVIFARHGLGVNAEGIRSVVYACVCLGTGVLLLRRREEGKSGFLVAAGTLAFIGLVAGIKGVVAVLRFNVRIGDCLSTLTQGIQATLRNGDATLQIYGSLLIIAVTVTAVILLRQKLEGRRLTILLIAFATIPAYSALSHWFDNEQRGHLFGYWFGHDMFTPPFTAPDGTLSYDPELREELLKDPEQAKLIYPEMTRDAILFGGTDPGRFCPTYMIFCESFIPPRCKPLDPNFDRRDVYIITQNALADGTYLHYIRAHYNKSEQRKFDTPFFQEFLRSKTEREQNYKTNALARLAYRVIDQPLLRVGERIETARREEGVYPPEEIYIPSPADSSRCFEEYLKDAQIRLQQNRLKPGEDVRVVNNRVQVSGQVAVMAINGYLTKVIFDNNPDNEFFVEESFPLDWMYPHLTPFGIIMKINREPLAGLSEEILARDHHFWREFSQRCIGDWITYDTPVSEIAAFAKKTYLRHDLEGFEGDPKFVRDDQSQKAFSKLRSSIAGVYAWRLGPEARRLGYAPKTPAERERLIKEADFAFRQAFAFCPYSPEAVYRYVSLLMGQQRHEDARLVAETCLALDPYNGQIAELVRNLQGIPAQQAQMQQASADLSRLQQEWDSSGNLQVGLQLAGQLVSFGQTNAALTVLDQVLASPDANDQAILACAQGYMQLRNLSGLEKSLLKLTQVTPQSAEAWYDLAAIRATLNKRNPALEALQEAIRLSDIRRATKPNAKDLRAEAAKDQRFMLLRTLPEFNTLVPAS